jgi:hypothetical protein
MGSKQPAQTRSPDWWWPPRIVGLGALVLSEVVAGAGDSDSPMTWLVLATGLLAVAAVALPIQWGQGLHLFGEHASAAATGSERLRMSRRWRRLATVGWTLLTLTTLVLVLPLVFWGLGSLPEDRMRTVTLARIALVVAWGIPTLLLAGQLWTQRTTLKAVALERSAAQARPRHARGGHLGNDRAPADEQAVVHDGRGGQRSGGAEASEPGTLVAGSPLFRYRRGGRQLTVWPDGTLEEDAGGRTRRVSLVDALEVSVDYDGELVIVGRDKAFAPRTEITVGDRAGDRTTLWVRWGMPQSVIAQFQQIAGGFGATIVDLLPPPAAPTPGTRRSWRAKLANAATWVSGVAAFLGSTIFIEVITGSDVASDETDPRLWGAVLVCSCLTATGLLTVLDPPFSLGRLGLGLVDLIVAVWIPLHWGFLTGATGAEDAAVPGLAYRPLSPPELARGRADAKALGQSVREGDFRLVVTRIACGTDLQLGSNTASEGEQLCLASITVTNVSDHEVDILTVDSLLFDNHGQPAMPLYDYDGSDLSSLDPMSPHQALTTTVGYGIPTGATPALIMFQETDENSRRVVINVGSS